jgi:hypothetical protein
MCDMVTVAVFCLDDYAAGGDEACECGLEYHHELIYENFHTLLLICRVNIVDLFETKQTKRKMMLGRVVAAYEPDRVA